MADFFWSAVMAFFFSERSARCSAILVKLHLEGRWKGGVTVRVIVP